MGNEKKYKTTSVEENLIDAGCCSQLIHCFFDMEKEGEREKQIHLLRRHRARLLDEVHENQKKLDCLDYLLYQMKKENKNK